MSRGRPSCSGTSCHGTEAPGAQQRTESCRVAPPAGQSQLDLILMFVQRGAVRPAASTTHDWIGPPNPLSNLRPIVYRVPEDESLLETQLRRLRQETEDWNHDFWTKQNVSFSKEKETFIVSQLKSKGLTLRDDDGRRRNLNTEEMSQFYKSFLDKNRIRHSTYNREWYRRNLSITLLMARVALNNLWKRSSRPRPQS